VSREEALDFHKQSRGKIEIFSRTPLDDTRDLSLAYTPGVAEPCKEIHKDVSKVYEYTNKGNMVAVVTDGSAVLGLGDIGPEAGLPVMEGKCQLFKAFAGVDAFPICVSTKDVDDIVDTVVNISPTFGGINLEDISAPRCFEVERKLKEKLNIPVFHDDQHGTAVVVLAALINTLKLTGRQKEDLKVVISGAGAASIAVFKILYSYGVKDIVITDSRGVICPSRSDLNSVKREAAKLTEKSMGYDSEKNTCSVMSLAEAMVGRDVFIGLSKGGIVTKEMVKSMNPEPIIFAMANPDPEILPEDAISAGAGVVATGRSDYPNQINNVLGFPGIFRGALDCMASDINEEMKLAAANALAESVGDRLSKEFIIPNPLDITVAPRVAEAVCRAAIATGVAQNNIKPESVRDRAECLIKKTHELMKKYVENETTAVCNVYLH